MSDLRSIIFNGIRYYLDVGIDANEVNEIIDDYVEEHNITGVTAEEVQEMVDDYLDGSADAVISDWLDDHPEATTTVQDGSITLAKLASDVSAKFAYKWVANGYMREHVRPFQGWAQNVVYDPDLDKAVGIINSGNASHTNAQPWYRVTIDKTGYMSPYEEVAVYDTDGTTPYVPVKGYMGCTCRLSDGSYMCVDGSQIIYKSTDKLKTLVKQRQYAFTSNADGSMFTLTELSNGRLIIGHGGWVNGFWYSDDDGVTWTNVVPSASGLGNMIYPERQHTPFEPCFIEIGSGKVLAVARKSMNAQASATRGYAVKEPAVYSVSEDYGATWSAWANSTVITDMTACNGKAVIIGDKVHFVYGSRYGNVEAGQNFQLFYTYASLADAYEDNWATPVVIEHGHWDASTATNPHDSGYPSVWADENANLYSVYYDGDGTGSAFGANWRLCTGSPVAKLPALNADGGGSYNVGYTQKAVDKKMSLIWAKINEILLLIGQMPDDSGDYDGTSPIFDGLVAWYDVTNASKWDEAALDSMIGESTAYSTNNSMTYLSKKSDSPTSFDNGFGNNVAALFVQSTIGALIGSASTFTVEFVDYIKTNQNIFAVKASTAYGNSNANPSVFFRNNNFGEYKSNIHHLVGIFSSGSVSWYVDGTHIADESTEVSYSDIVAGYLLFVAPGTDGKMGDVRIYDRALTADEIRNNYLYTQNETDYSTAPVFE